MTRVVVTGGSGRVGTWVIRDLLEHGYEVISVDMTRPAHKLCRHVTVNTRNTGDLFYAFREAQAIIHLAAIPSPGGHPDSTVVENNVVSTYCVLDTAAAMGIEKVVMASSICAYGMVNAIHPILPHFLPLTEDHALLPQDSYGLSKMLDETSAAAIHRRAGTQVISLRITTVITPDLYERFETMIQPHWLHERVLWSYVDVRDVAAACRMGIEATGIGAIALNIGAADSGVNVETKDLVAQYFAQVVDIRGTPPGYQTLFCIDRAEQVLGWKPKYSWRENMESRDFASRK